MPPGMVSGVVRSPARRNAVAPPTNAPAACKPTGNPTIRASGSPCKFSMVPLITPIPKGPFSLYK